MSTFLLSKFEVTVDQWHQFAESTGWPTHWGKFYFTSEVGRNIDFQMPSDWPMYYVSWYDAIAYCNWRSSVEHLDLAYEYDTSEMQRYLEGPAPTVLVRWNRRANGYRLPTEAEWEYAASGGRMRKAVVPDRLASGWFYENSGREPHSVGTKSPNALGLFDMLGNVAEWCWDYYRPEYHAESRRNPIGPPSGSDPVMYPEGRTDIRVFRGGSWMTKAEEVTHGWRGGAAPVEVPRIGLRLARNP